MSRVAQADSSNRRSGSPSSVLADIIDQVTAKLQAGDAIDWDGLVREHPEQADELRRLRPALDVLDELSRSGSSAVAVAGDEADGVAGTLGDFRVVREIGRGGMGVVYEAEQVSLGRRVALKVLPLAATMDPRRLQRFHNEAKAAACLHHTNIVPVFAVGCERGVHFYAMQLIDGVTLACVIRDLRQLEQKEPAAEAREGAATTAYSPAIAAITTVPAGAQSRTKPGRDTAYYRKVAELGAQAAEALDYAHQVGVVHRDVKPGNLMLDGRGAIWVMDFGLAQMQHGEGSLTITGDLVGTLRYMSPEQALGKRVVIDHRTDVYSLGATLYEMLTLRPVFEGQDRQELLRQVAVEEPIALRKLERGIPAELETIVLKAMEKSPADRYATAKEMADDLRRWLEDRPIRARRPALTQRLGKWVRRHRPLVASVAVLVFMVLLLGGAVLGQQMRQLAAMEQAVGDDLREADLLQQQERWPEELQVLERASGRLAAGGSSPLREGVQERRTNVAMVARLEEARLQASSAGPERGFDYTGADQAYAAAFASFGLNLATLTPEEAAERIRTSTIRTQLVAALDNWAFNKQRKRAGSEELVQVVARLADDDPWRQQLRDPEVCKDRAALERLAEAQDVLAQPPGNLILLMWAISDVQGRPAAVRLLRRAQQRHPADFWINFELGFRLYEEPATLAEAIGFYRAALALRPNSPVIYNILGIALHQQKKFPEAEAAYRKAIDLKPDFAFYYNLGMALREQQKLSDAETAYRKTIELKPDYADAYCNLGNALLGQKKLPEAEAVCRKAIELKPDHAIAYLSLGSVLYHQGKLSEAVAAYRKAIDLKPDFALAYSSLGNALRHEKNLAEAEAACRKAIKLKPDFAEAYYNLGIVLYDQKKLPEAAAAYRKAIELKPDYAEAYCNLGGALLDQKKLAEAAAAYRKAIELKPDLALAHRNIGRALWLQGKVDDAIAEYREAIRINKNDSDAHNNLGVALWAKGQLDEAIAECREAIRINKNNAEAHNSLAVYLHGKGRLEEAIAECRKALSLNKDFPEAHSNLGGALLAKGELDEAIAEFRKALRLNKDLPQVHNNLGNALLGKGQLDEAIVEFREAVRLKKDFAEAHCSLGDALLRQGQFQEAVQELRRGHELGSRNPRWPYAALSAQQLRNAERLANLDARLPGLLKGEEQPKDADERLALAQMCQQNKKLYAAAVRFFAQAFAAQPALVTELQAGRRYNAACAAALAGCGKGKDASGLDDNERARLRKQALDWLRADLTAWRNVLEKDKTAPVVGQLMQRWLRDPDFNGVRGAEALAKLPQAERGDWQKLWEEVAALRQRAQPKEK